MSGTWSRGIPTGWHLAVLPPRIGVSGVTPGHPFVVGVTAVVVIEVPDKQTPGINKRNLSLPPNGVPLFVAT